MATPETEENVQTNAQAEKAMEGSDAPAAPAEGVASDASAIEGSLPSFKEESYFGADLKESEKKALQEFRIKIEEAVRGNAFVLPKVEEAVKVADPILDKKAKEEAVAAETLEAAIAKDVSTEAVPAEAIVSAPSSESPAIVEKDAAEGVSVDPPVAPSPPLESSTTVGSADPVPAEAAVDEDISLWGVPLLHTKGDARTDVVLLKFLRARDSKVSNSFTMLKNTILWRKKFGADSILEEDFGTDFDCVAFLHGVDKQGHPVSYNIFGSLSDKDLYQKAFGDQAKTENFLRWRVHLLEKSIQLLNFNPGGANAIVQVIDLKNSPWPAKKELRTFINQALNLLQDNYPELVVKNVLINVPWYFSALYSIISPFLTQRTKSKFVLVRGGKVTEELFKLIAPEQVPIRYGGLSRVDDADFGKGEAIVTELPVKAGEKQTVEFEVPEEGGTVLWDVAVVGWDVSYGAEFVPNLQSGYTTIIEKTKKIVSQAEPVRNAFKATEAGKVLLTIDNTSSSKKKNAFYRYLVKQPSQ